MAKPESPVFLLAELPDGTPMMNIGIPLAGWVHLRTGNTYNFDLRKGGVPIVISIFGGTGNRDDMLAELQARAKEWGITISTDGPLKEYGLDIPKGH